MKKLLFGLSVLFAPIFVFAQQPPPTGLRKFVEEVADVIDLIIPLMFALALVAFLWGVLKFVFNAGDEEERSKGKQFMVWGIIGLFIMTAVWGLVNFLQDTTGIDASQPPVLPGVPT